MFQTPQFRTRVIKDFYPRAEQMRSKIDMFFGSPAQNGPQHQCFDVWYVENHYYYMRTNASNIIGHELYEDFRCHLQALAASLGLSTVSGSLISLYSHGCHQTVHSDCMNGTYGFVYSLTRWDTRNFVGGDTYVAKEGAFDQLEPRAHKASTNYWDAFPAHFGQLLLFDDRVAHMVPMVQGTMRPLDARIVLHGHLF